MNFMLPGVEDGKEQIQRAEFQYIVKLKCYSRWPTEERSGYALILLP